MTQTKKNTPPNQPNRKSLAGCCLSLLFALVAGVLWVVMIGSTLVQGCEEHRVLKEGTDATATILALEDTRNRMNENPVVRLTVEVEAEGRAPYRAEIVTPLSPVDLQNYRVGVDCSLIRRASLPR